MVPRERYTVRVNGGIEIAKGSLEQCVIESRRFLDKYAAIYLRRADDPNVVATFKKTVDGLTCGATKHGVDTNTPPWAARFLEMLTY